MKFGKEISPEEETCTELDLPGFYLLAQNVEINA
jgi:hypothetical protein